MSQPMPTDLPRLKGFNHNRNYQAYHAGFSEGKITGGLGAAVIVGAICQAGAIPFPLVGVFSVFAGCMGYLTGGFGGASLSEMWHPQNTSSADVSFIPGLLGGGILGTIIFMGPLILSINLDSPKNTKNPDEHIANNTKFIINFPQDLFGAEGGKVGDYTELNGDIPREAVEV